MKSYKYSRKNKKIGNYILIFTVFFLVIGTIVFFKKYIFASLGSNRVENKSSVENQNRENDIYSVFSEIGGTVEKQDDKVIIIFDDESKAFLPNSEDESAVMNLLDMLKKIRQKYTIENKVVDIIDLRYSRPIIKLKN